MTKKEKQEAAKEIIKGLLADSEMKANDLIDRAAELFTQRFGDEKTDNANDVKGRIGSILDVMKKDADVLFEGGRYALKKEVQIEKAQQEPKKRTRKTKAKTEEKEEKTQKTDKVKIEKKTEEKPVKAKRATKKKAEPLPSAPLQPIAPVAPITPENAPEPIPETTERTETPQKEEKEENATTQTTIEEKPVKKRGRKPQAKKTELPVELSAETNVQTETKVQTEKQPTVLEAEKPVEVAKETELKNLPVVREKGEISTKNTVMDMSFLFGAVKPVKREEKPVDKAEKTEKKQEGSEKAQIKAQSSEKKAQVKEEETPRVAQEKTEKRQEQTAQRKNEEQKPARKPAREQKRENGKPSALTAEEKLQEAFIKKLHRLGGEYFEYYSVYLLEKYSRRNGRRLESLKITGGDHDGGIDGEIELTDKLGFRETIYIQSKNWDPDKGDEKLWVVGETLLQQFIGACVCRQAKDGKQHCRGIFITTSRFTPEAKHILEETSDKFVGYDASDLFEAAKECEFGLVKKNGEWTLDEDLLAGTKAFFNML